MNEGISSVEDGRLKESGVVKQGGEVRAALVMVDVMEKLVKEEVVAAGDGCRGG